MPDDAAPTSRADADPAARRSTVDLLCEVLSVTEDALVDSDIGKSFQRLLDLAIDVTGAAFGFIGEIQDDPPVLRSRALTDVSWDEASRAVYESAGPEGFLFASMHSLYGEVMRTWAPVITSDPDDPRRGGVPPGHPVLEHFLGAPFESRSGERGMIGLANRPGGFTEDHLAQLAPILTAAASALSADAILRSRADAESLLARLRRLDALTAGLAHAAVGAEDDAVDESAIDRALAELGELGNADRTYVFEFDLDNGMMSNTFEWCAPGVEPMQHILQDLPVAMFPWAMRQFRGRTLVYSTTAELPPDATAERATLEEQGVTAVLWIPLFDGPEMIGFLGFDQVGGARRWGDLERSALEQLGGVLSLTLARFRARELLRISESRLRHFTERLDVAVVITDVDMRTGRFANPAFERLTGVPANRFLEDPAAVIRAVTHQDDFERLVAAYTSMLRQLDDPDEDPHLDETFRIVRPDGEVRWVRNRLFPTESARGASAQIGALIDDITDVRLLQEELTKALDRVAASSRTKSEFLSRVSHELRSPLQGTLGFIELLRLDPDTPERDRFLDLAERSTHHLVDLIDELLEVGRIETGRLQLTYQDVDLGQLAADTLALCSPHLREYGVEASLDAPGLVSARTDSRRLGQILVNLVTNAAKYNRRGGSVRLRVFDTQGVAVVEVSDTGLGLTEDEISRMFVPFERFHTDRTSAPGTGIGLPVVKQLTRALGIDLTVESEPGVGSTFRLRIPQEIPRARTSGPFRVLCIDDNPDSLVVLDAALRRLPDVEIRTAGDLESAFADAVLARPDLVLIDRHLPDGDGIAAIDRFAALGEERRPINVAVVTADTEPETRERAVRAGAIAFFTKPIKLVALIDFVRERAGSR